MTVCELAEFRYKVYKLRVVAGYIDCVAGTIRERVNV